MLFGVYYHKKVDPESDLILMCTCMKRNSAELIVNALLYKDTSGRNDDSGLYDYYINEIKYIDRKNEENS